MLMTVAFYYTYLVLLFLIILGFCWLLGWTRFLAYLRGKSIYLRLKLPSFWTQRSSLNQQNLRLQIYLNPQLQIYHSLNI